MMCARRARTGHFYVVDADNEVTDFDFGYKVPFYDVGYVHLWQAKNPVNGLVYGWGGIKLFSKKMLLGHTRNSLDMTTGFPLKLMEGVKSVTHFNYAPFETWRSAFRECVKLSISEDPDAVGRLAVWTSIAHGPFAEFCLKGANEGRCYGLENRSDPEKLALINDYDWLRERFEASGAIQD